MAASIYERTFGRPYNGVAPDEPDGVNDLDSMPLAMAKAQLGLIVGDTISRSRKAPKQFGDKGRISRVCSGEEIPEWLARIWANPKVRREWVLLQIEDSCLFDTCLQLTERKTG